MSCLRPGSAALLSLGLSLAVAGGAAAAPIPVSGRVVDESGRGLAGARVLLLPVLSSFEAGERALAGAGDPEPAATATCDGSGAYRLAAPAAGMWRLRVEAPGRLEMEATLEPLLEPLELPPVEPPPRREMTLAVVGGRGDLLSGARLRADSSPGWVRPGDRSVRNVWSAAPRHGLTDETGRARLAVGEGEALEVFALGPRGGEALGNGLRGEPFPLTLPVVEPLPIELRDARRQPLTGVLVRLGLGGWPVGVTGEDGRLALGAPSGAEAAITFETADLRGGRALLRDEARRAGHPLRLAVEEPQRVSGRVSDAATGRPLSGALVWASSDPARFAVTGGDGRFRLEVAPVYDEGASLHAAAVGHFPDHRRLARPEPPRELEGSLELSPTALLSGRVVDEQGAALAGAELMLGAMGGLPGWGNGRSHQERTESDADGRFRLPVVSGAFYLLDAFKEGFAPAHLEVSDPGREVQVVLARGGVAHGRVLGPAGEAIEGARVVLSWAEGGTMRGWLPRLRPPPALEGTTSAAGSFSLAPLEAGRFHLDVEAAGFAPARRPGVAVPATRGPFDLGTVRLEAGVSLIGKVVDPAGRPIEDAMVSVFNRAWRPSDGNEHGRLAASEEGAMTGPDGSFRIDDLRRGERLDLFARRDGYVDAALQGVVVPASEDLRLVLEPGATVRGQVVDGAGGGLDEASVSVGGAAAAGTWSGRAAGTDDEGRFELSGLRPGRLRLSAWADGFEPAELALTLEPGEVADGLSLVLTEGAVVEGRLSDLRGEPLRGYVAIVEGILSPSLSHLGNTFADETGRYRLRGLAPGEYRIEARADSTRRMVRSVRLAVGTNRLDFVFPEGQEVRGRVIDGSGKGVGGGLVMLVGLGGGDGGVGTSGAQGEFRIEGVNDGEYRVRVTKGGYPTAELEGTVRVDGAPVSGIEVMLAEGGAIRGAVLGLEPESFPGVQVSARHESDPEWAGAAVDGEGRYELTALAPGPWIVAAADHRTGRTVERRVLLEERQRLAGLDLDFDSGVAISGRVRIDGEPASGTGVSAQGLDVAATAQASCDAQGRFELAGLAPGEYRLVLEVVPHGARYERTVAAEASTEITIDLATARLAGVVVAAEGGRPLPRAVVHLESGPGAAGLDRPAPVRTETDGEGRFDFDRVAEGEARLTAQASGYAAASVDLTLAAGGRHEAELVLTPTPGLTLDVRLATGHPPGSVVVGVLTGDRPGVAGIHSPDEAGRIHLASLSPGRHELLVAAQGTAQARLAVEVPGPPVPVLLTPATQLEVAVPDLADSTATARLVLYAADGSPHLALLGWGGLTAEWPVRSGRAEVWALPPGVWTVEVQAADGRAWRGEAVAPEGGGEVAVVVDEPVAQER